MAHHWAKLNVGLKMGPAVAEGDRDEIPHCGKGMIIFDYIIDNNETVI